MKKILCLFCSGFIVLAALLSATPAAAQTPEPGYRLHSQRLFGYGGFGGDVRGSFRFSVSGPADNIQSVTYLIDGQPMATVSQPPFSFDFQTGSYPDGWHQFAAQITTREGSQVTTPATSLNFLSAAQQNSSMGKILIPLFGGVALVMLIMVAAQAIGLRRNPGRLAPGTTRHYGIKGGTICPRCGRPFPIHFWSLNLPGAHLDRCDYCGRFGLVTRRSPAELQAAEVAEVAAAQSTETSLPGAVEESDSERLRKLLDESKYTK